MGGLGEIPRQTPEEIRRQLAQNAEESVKEAALEHQLAGERSKPVVGRLQQKGRERIFGKEEIDLGQEFEAILEDLEKAAGGPEKKTERPM